MVKKLNEFSAGSILALAGTCRISNEASEPARLMKKCGNCFEAGAFRALFILEGKFQNNGSREKSLKVIGLGPRF